MPNMRPPCRKYTLAILVAAVGFLAACSSSNLADPTTYPVTGLVTFEGSPVDGALVVLRPKANDGATTAQATTDAEGIFDVHIFLEMGKRTKRGLMPADYQIEVTQLVKATGEASIFSPPKNMLPEKYASVQTSGLETTVSAESKNELVLELSNQ
ncbi:MAG: hypothetical protein GXP24_02485 [Planctomycetes bacterium]|nr:hypothetical protein [Planctomycetota bacterium]